MRMCTALLATFVGVCVAPMAAAEDSRHFEVIGVNPADGTSYAGDVLMQKTGETYRLEWSLGGKRITGTAIGDGQHLAVTTERGMALYRADGPGFERIWTSEGGFKRGTEQWVAW